jgi:solute carrier family 25 oxoglutarate transporter 11
MSLFKPFIVGSISGCIATSVIQPVDTVKVIIQSKKEAAGRTAVNVSPFHIARELIQSEGVAGSLSEM